MAAPTTCWFFECFAILIAFLLAPSQASTTLRPAVVSSHPCNGIYYHGLGCFSSSYPFNNTPELPQNPDFIDTAFQLYTRSNSDTPQVLANRGGDIGGSNLKVDKPIKILIHGFLQSNQSPWILNMTQALLAQDDVNVITVNWGQGAGFPYTQAAANTRVVGMELARLMEAMRRQKGVDLRQFHLIGHSLGAHVAGHAGTRHDGKIGRISGLDPADPNFSFQSPEVRLDPTDARYVDVIHTDGSPYTTYNGYGTLQPMGHIDFYPNGGENQPGCHVDTSVYTLLRDAYREGMENAEEDMACSHDRSLSLYIESISSPCPFTAYPCASEDDFSSGRCLDCGSGPCPSLGYKADVNKRKGSFYLNTTSLSPFCGYHYAVRVVLSEASSTVDGDLDVQLTGTRGRSTASLPLYTGTMAPGQEVTSLLLIPRDMGPATQVSLTFTRATSYFNWVHWMTSASIKVKGVVVEGLQSTNARYFCPPSTNEEVRSGGQPLTMSSGSIRQGACFASPSHPH